MASQSRQCAEHQQHVLRFLSEHHRRAVNGEQVAQVELPDELHSHFPAVYLEIHTLEMTLQQPAFEVCHGARGVCLHHSLGVLHHHHSVLVVGVGYGESRLGQSVEERLLGIAVVLKRLVVVQMVAREVGEHSSCEVQTAYALLRDGMRAAFHERILTSCLHHACQQGVEFYRVGRGVVGWNLLVHNIVAHRREQSALVAQLCEHII